MNTSFSQQYFISGDEIVFKGHFPNSPVFPGVLLIGMTTDLIRKSIREPISLAKISRHRFSGMVQPDDQITIKIKVKKSEPNGYLISSIASVDEKTVAKGKFHFLASEDVVL